MPSGKPLPSFIVCLILIVVFCVVWFSPIQLWICAPCQPIHSLTSSLLLTGGFLELGRGKTTVAVLSRQRVTCSGGFGEPSMISGVCCHVSTFSLSFCAYYNGLITLCLRVSRFLQGSGLNPVVGGRYVIGWKCFPIGVGSTCREFLNHTITTFIPLISMWSQVFGIPVHPYISGAAANAKPASSFPAKDQQHMVQWAFAMASAGCLVLCRRLTIALMLHTTASEGCFIPSWTAHLDTQRSHHKWCLVKVEYLEECLFGCVLKWDIPKK